MKKTTFKATALAMAFTLAVGAEKSLRENFSQIETNKDAINLVISSAKDTPIADVVKEAIIGTNADSALLGSIVTVAAAIAPDQTDLIKLTALTYAPDAFIEFSGSSKAVRGAGVILYDVYGNPIGRAIQVSEDEYTVFNTDGLKVGTVTTAEKEEIETLAVGLALRGGKKMIFFPAPGIKIAFVFGKSPIATTGNGGVLVSFSVNGNLIATPNSDFTADSLEPAGVARFRGRQLITSDVIDDIIQEAEAQVELTGGSLVDAIINELTATTTPVAGPYTDTL